MSSSQALYANHCTAQSEAKDRVMDRTESRIISRRHSPFEWRAIVAKHEDLPIGLTLESTDHDFTNEYQGARKPLCQSRRPEVLNPLDQEDMTMKGKRLRLQSHYEEGSRRTARPKMIQYQLEFGGVGEYVVQAPSRKRDSLFCKTSFAQRNSAQCTITQKEQLRAFLLS